MTARLLGLCGLPNMEGPEHWPACRASRMVGVGHWGRLLGSGALLVAGLILTGADRQSEAALVKVSPAWLTDLTRRF